MVYANLHTLGHKDKIAQSQTNHKEGSDQFLFGNSYFGPCYGNTGHPNYPSTFVYLTPPSAPPPNRALIRVYS